MTEFNPDRIVYVTDERQQLHFKQFFTVCAKLGYTRITSYNVCYTKLLRTVFFLCYGFRLR